MRFYKFRNYNEETKSRTLEIIEKQELYFSSIEGFNDPFDGKVHLNFAGELDEIRASQIRVQYVEKLKKNKYEGISIESAKKLVFDKIVPEFIESQKLKNIRLKRIQDIHNEKGVLSLSAKNDNILMWSHYTHNHRGICFGFEFSGEPFNKIKRVRYQSHYDDIPAWLHTDNEIVNRILFSKALDWQYEEEYRIIKDYAGSQKLPKNSIKEIIFGSKMEKNDRNEIIEICKKNDLNPEFKIAKLDLQRYKLNIESFKA